MKNSLHLGTIGSISQTFNRFLSQESRLRVFGCVFHFNKGDLHLGGILSVLYAELLLQASSRLRYR